MMKVNGANKLSIKDFQQNKTEYVFNILYGSENIHTAIREVLELAACHYSFERAYIFEFSADGQTASKTFEWCGDFVMPKMKEPQNLSPDAVTAARLHFYENRIFVARNLKKLNTMEFALYESQGIKNMIRFGIFDKNQLLGFIGFDNCHSDIFPTQDKIDELAILCNILSIFMIKPYMDQAASNVLLLFQDVMNSLDNYVYMVNLQSFEVLFMNKKVRSALNESETDQPCYQFFRGNDAQCPDCPIRCLKDGVNHSEKEIYNEKLHIWTNASVSTLRWYNGKTVCLVNCADISKQKLTHLQHTEQLEKIVYVDKLTGGRSYYKFKEDGQRIIDHKPDATFLILKMDIENFKLINQRYSYNTGDTVLRKVAIALSQTIKEPDDIFARTMNDEFVALVNLQDSYDPQVLYEDFIRNFQALIGNELPFRYIFPQGRYVVCPNDLEKPDIMDMLERANLAHKAAKQDKALDCVTYDESMIELALHNNEIENRMGKALEQCEFLVYLQPKYRLLDQTIGGAEALVRWKNSDGELWYPDTFIPVFEQNGFITKLDFYMLDKVCCLLTSWCAQGFAPIVISVNFSRLHLNNPYFVDDLCAIVDRYGIEHKYIEIEITETVIYDNIDKLRILLDALHKSGFSMSMDDFGTGYSSLGMLKDLSVDVIKMDRSFFVNQADAERSKIVMRHIIGMAKNLEISVVAEGIEQKDCFELLRDLNCELGQGYYFARPMPAEEFKQFLTI